MKWVLIMTLYVWGPSPTVSNFSVEFNRQDDCDRAAHSWVAAQPRRMMTLSNRQLVTAFATCVEKHR